MFTKQHTDIFMPLDSLSCVGIVPKKCSNRLGRITGFEQCRFENIPRDFLNVF